MSQHLGFENVSVEALSISLCQGLVPQVLNPEPRIQAPASSSPECPKKEGSTSNVCPARSGEHRSGASRAVAPGLKA